MITCKRCGWRNHAGRETCEHCKAPLLDIQTIIETDRRMGDGIRGGILGALLVGAIFLAAFTVLCYGHQPAIVFMDLAIWVVFAGVILGGLSGFLVGILTRR